ncbi:hypothetical protein HGRIS_004684 [Hohenbuehelia grisea]|uniref:Peptidase M43 pregnancy-associated plasma-A domain-containing protein n=1 Tax=Hohenbuehelia grisea TaxID=104357 RepID=A0ABR3JD15_9AGAR
MIRSILKSNKTSGTLGFATFPYRNQNPSSLARDGIVLKNSALPGGASQGYNTGKVLVHEVGHWVGLYHTFEALRGVGGSNGGDYVADTPAEASAATNCSPRDSCPNLPGSDPVQNHMDYSGDGCRDQFTRGQFSRIQDQMRTYRGVII